MSNATSAPVDAVFVIGTGSKNNNEELKYALRNLEKNCSFIRNVYISGECPSWVDVTAVRHLKWPDRFSHAKDANIIDKLRHACEQPDIAKKVLFCSDDQFQTRPCTWEDFSPRWLRRYSETDNWYESRKRLWHTRLHKTLERDRLRRVREGLNTSNIFYYQPHIWMPIDRDKFIEYAKWSDYEHRDDTIIASGYFNFIDAGGETNFDHIFISAGQNWPVKETHVAYSDPSFSSAMSYLQKKFDAPSKYEVSYKKTTISNAIKAIKEESPSIPNEEDLILREDEKTITEAKNAILKEPLWENLHKEIDYAEMMRKEKYVGWRRVWNDILLRWSATTNHGRLYIPVLKDRGEEALQVVERFKEERLGIKRVKQDADQSKSPPQEEQKGHHCSKCEERRRKALEQKRLQEQESKKHADELKQKIEALNKDKAQSENKITTEHKILETSTVPVTTNSIVRKTDTTSGCIECAISHLSVAIAQLNSNAGRPSALDLELAKGEVSVASQQLLALKRNEAYNKCIQAMDSVYSDNSIFSVTTLREILSQVLDGK